MTPVEKEAVGYLSAHEDRFSTMKLHWEDLEARYSNHMREGSISDKTEGRVPLGKAYSMLENSLPRLLSQQPRFKYMAVEPTDEEAAEKYERFCDYQWREAEVQDKLVDLVRWGGITGLVGWKVGWKSVEKLKKKKTKEILGVEVKNPILQKFVKAKKKEVVEKEQNYTFHTIKPFDLVWDVDATDPRDAKAIGHKTRYTLKQLEVLGFDKDKLTPAKEEPDYWRDRMEEKDDVTGETKRENPLVELVELYVKHLDKGVEKIHVVYLINGKSPVVVRSEECPFDEQFIPMGVWRPVRRPGKFYGFGIIEPVIGLLDAEEDYFNMLLEAEWVNISRPMLFNPMALHNPEEITFEPRTLIPIKGSGDVRQAVSILETPKADIGGGMAMMQYLKAAQQNTSGITDFQTGADEIKGAKTLGEIRIKTEEANARLRMMLDSLEKEVLNPLGRMVLSLNKQYLSDEPDIYFRVMGRKGDLGEETINFETIDSIKDLSVVSGSSAMVVQQSEIQKWSLLLDKAAQEMSFGPMGVPIDREKIWENLLERGLLIQDIESYLPSVKEREEQEVGANVDQLELAIDENNNIYAARVTPDQNHEVHLRMHRTAFKAGKTKDRELSDQELLRLQDHIDETVSMMGGQTPNYAQAPQPMAGGGGMGEAPSGANAPGAGPVPGAQSPTTPTPPANPGDQIPT